MDDKRNKFDKENGKNCRYNIEYMNEKTKNSILRLKEDIKSDETYINYLQVLKELINNEEIFNLLKTKNELEKELEVLIKCEKEKDEVKILSLQKEISEIYKKLQEYELFIKALLLKREYENLMSTIQEEIFDCFEETNILKESIKKEKEYYKDFKF